MLQQQQHFRSSSPLESGLEAEPRVAVLEYQSLRFDNYGLKGPCLESFRDENVFRPRHQIGNKEIGAHTSLDSDEKLSYTQRPSSELPCRTNATTTGTMA